MVDQYGESLEQIGYTIDDMETEVFDDAGSGHVERIYNLKQQISRFRRAAVPLLRPLERLVTGALPGMEPSVVPYFRDVHDHAQHVADVIESHDRLLIDILQADLTMTGIRQSEIGMRQNEDMRRISAWAAIAVVPTATAGIYGMNFANMPELAWRYGYYVILVLMLVVCVSLYRMFRRKGWP